MGGRAAKARTAAGAPSTPTTSYYYLNNIPFADHGALLDPPTEDVTGAASGMLAQLGETADSPRVKGRHRLSRTGATEGRKLVRPLGVNYIYGTWSALAG